MLEVCASKIGDIILSVLESKMENKLDEVKKAKIISDTRKSICEFEEKYLQNHDGTVLTSREFGEYLQYSKPIEEIFSTIWDTSTEIAGTTEIVEKLLLDFQCTGIVDFLCVTDFPLDKTLKVICFMAKCKFEKILSDEIISVLIQKFDEVESDEEREKCMTLWFEFFDVLDKKEDESEYKGLFVQNVLIALQAYLRKGGSEQEIRNLTRKPMIKVAICLLYNSKCIDLQYDEKRVLPATKV